MGANGSGKSTLVRALTGLLPLDRRDRSSCSARRSTTSTTGAAIGFVPQRVGAGVRRTGVGVGGRRLRPARPGAGCSARSSRADRAAIDDALESSGSPTGPATASPTLSGGQQQRALIARALAGEPELFFLDEPTAGVDLPNQQALADALAELKERGATIVLVAHELGPLAGLVDRAVVMRDGRVVYDGAAARRPRRAPAGLRRAAHTTTTPIRPARPRAPGRLAVRAADARRRLMGPVHLRLHAAGADRRGRHRAGRARRRHLPGPAPAGADGRRHRPRRRHRRRPGAAHRHLPHLDGGRRRDPRRRPDRADPRARPRPTATSPWRCCSTAAWPAACCSPGSPAQSAARLQQYLFGSITTISVADVLADDGAGRGRGRGLRRAGAAAVRGRPGPGVRPGRRAERPRSTTCWSRCSPRSA